MAASPPAWLVACDLPQAWRNRDSWRVLDTAFGDGSLLLALWELWAQDTHAARALHVVAICQVPPPVDALVTRLEAIPALRSHAVELERQWFGFLSGFHRLELHGGRLRLTLCVGPLDAMLRAQQFEADAIFVKAPDGGGDPEPAQPVAPWDKHRIKAVTRLCRRGTAIAIDADCAIPSEARVQAGIVPTHGHACDTTVQACRFQPHWQIATTRSAWRRAPAVVDACVVVGAGLAGATMAYALARRGWQVTVLDSATMPAAGASGLPVGLLVPQVSRDDNLRSRLARAGIRMTVTSASHLLARDQDWAWTGVAELDPNWRCALPGRWSQAGRQWSQAGLAQAPAHRARLGSATTDGGIWHAAAGWVKPARLVQACLAHPGIRFVARQTVEAIAYRDGHWRALDAGGAVLARARHLVLACAGDAARLAAHLAPSEQPCRMPLSPVDGQVSWALHKPGDDALFPPFAVNGAGSAIAHVPQSGATTAWFVGATYETPAQAALDGHAAHAENLARLSQLLPDAAKTLAPDFSDDTVHAWRGTRWTTPDRLPVAGAVCAATQPGLWVSAAMGSRGLTYAVLCAEIVASQLGAEPAPVEARLLQCLGPARFASHEL